MSFFSLRDTSGTAQVVVRRSNAIDGDILSRMSEVPVESVVIVKGKVKSRPQNARMSNQSTGDIEVAAEEFILLNAADEMLPFYPHDEHNLSPQQPKQLLICSGAVDKYFQFARCFRDEDGRKDRQPEFTQVDLEMAFTSWGPRAEAETSSADAWSIGGTEVRDTIEEIIRDVWQKSLGVTLPGRFPVLSYREAMKRFGSDKPDTRFGLEFHQLELSSPDLVMDYFVIPARDTSPAAQALKQADSELSNKAQEDDVCRIVVSEDNASNWSRLVLSRSIHPKAKVRQDVLQATLPELRVGDVVWASVRDAYVNTGSTALGRIRLRLAELAQQNHGLDLPGFNFLWVTEFPLFTHDSDKEFMARGRWSSSHHPFTAPMWQDIGALFDGKFEQVRGQHYDLVLNGVEIAGGSILAQVVLQLTENELSLFDHLLQALRYGAPPHGGIAIGFDRLMSIICNTKSIRDVIAFPKTAGGTDPVFKSPSPIPKDTLRDYALGDA
ncbi:hypothetical protein FRB99_003613 [Tulasnella sp. 403]|nr:hypothetical protein FRB99_003613 [Tulasnella sp. 403]